MSEVRAFSIAVIVGMSSLLIGCGERVYISKSKSINTGYDTYDIKHVEYEGHTYIVIEGFHRGGITHDPDCECFKKEE